MQKRYTLLNLLKYLFYLLAALSLVGGVLTMLSLNAFAASLPSYDPLAPLGDIPLLGDMMGDLTTGLFDSLLAGLAGLISGAAWAVLAVALGFSLLLFAVGRLLAQVIDLSLRVDSLEAASVAASLPLETHET